MRQMFYVLFALVAMVSAAPAQKQRTDMHFHKRATSHPTDHHHLLHPQRSSSSSSLQARGSATSRQVSWQCATTTTLVPGVDSNTDNNGPGVQLQNEDDETRSFYFYQNSCDAIPFQYITLAPHTTRFVSVPADFQGRITRGTDEFYLKGVPQTLGTWVEITIDSGVAWGDVSLIRGCDGAATMQSLDESGAQMGFDTWLLDGAPEDAYDTKESGVKVIRATGDVPLTAQIDDKAANAAELKKQAVARDYLGSKIGDKSAYIDNVHGNPVIMSKNGQFKVVFYRGRP